MVMPEVDSAEHGRAPIGVTMLIHRFHPYIGGAETQLKALLPHLARLGVRVQVITREEPGSPTFDEVDGARVYRVPLLSTRGAASLAYTARALHFLHAHRSTTQVIHSHGLLSPSTTAMVARLALGIPAIATTHGFQADLALLRHGVLGSPRFRAISTVMDRFIVISSEIGRGLRAEGVPRRKLVTIPNGIDADRFSPADPDRRIALRSQLGIEGRRVVLYVGRLEDVKGPDLLFNAWPLVRKAVPDAELLIAGDGMLRQELERSGVPHVRFLGSQPDPLDLYQAADCFVLPSRSEGLPVALLEALSVGLPVVSTAVGGAPEILAGYERETLVRPGDVEALAEGLVDRLRTPPPLSSRRALRSRVQLEYSIQRAAASLAELYGSLIMQKALM
jgi:glycosyltransferase involved in cell wall biosynthesis